MSASVWVNILKYGIPCAVGLVGLVATTYAALERRHHERYTDRRAINQDRPKRQCGICLKQMKEAEVVNLPCTHSFCVACLEPLLSKTQTTCSVCRKEISPSFIRNWKLTH